MTIIKLFGESFWSVLLDESNIYKAPSIKFLWQQISHHSTNIISSLAKLWRWSKFYITNECVSKNVRYYLPDEWNEWLEVGTRISIRPLIFALLSIMRNMWSWGINILTEDILVLVYWEIKILFKILFKISFIEKSITPTIALEGLNILMEDIVHWVFLEHHPPISRCLSILAGSYRKTIVKLLKQNSLPFILKCSQIEPIAFKANLKKF